MLLEPLFQPFTSLRAEAIERLRLRRMCHRQRTAPERVACFLQPAIHELQCPALLANHQPTLLRSSGFSALRPPTILATILTRADSQSHRPYFKVRTETNGAVEVLGALGEGAFKCSQR